MALSFFRFKVGFQHGANRMSAQEEIRTTLDQLITAAGKGDFAPFVTALHDDLEVFDHVPYRFDSKSSFLEFIQRGMASAESATFALHQRSCRAITDTCGVVNAYDRLVTTPKGGGAPRVVNERTTLVLAMRGAQWKIVSAHFSTMPKE
jgi:ketosteroid isomerase-like protein